jgi:trehalose/maltose hydrolase-like predicted phosphorylase
MGNSAGGVHVGALGGLWQAAVMGFGGLDVGPEGPLLRPNLPGAWQRLELSVRWHGERRDLTATPGTTQALAPEAPIAAEGS